MRLVADAMLGRLAKWLRVLGYDTVYWRGDDAGLVRLAVAERRLVLTRDTRLPSRLPPGRTLLIESDHYEEQLYQVAGRLGLPLQVGQLIGICFWAGRGYRSWTPPRRGRTASAVVPFCSG
jgi:uncharacterized protein with PIN domain